MTIILAADNDWAIGKNGGLLADIPEDMKDQNGRPDKGSFGDFNGQQPDGSFGGQQ